MTNITNTFTHDIMMHGNQPLQTHNYQPYNEVSATTAQMNINDDHDDHHDEAGYDTLKYSILSDYNTNIISSFMAIQPMAAPVGMIFMMHKSGNTIELKSHVIEVQSRQLNVFVTHTLLDDINKLHNLNNIEVAKSIAAELRDDMHRWMSDTIYVNSSDVDFRIDVTEKPQDIVSKLMDASATIKNMSGRGFGNKWILPIDVFYAIMPLLYTQGDWIPAKEGNQSCLVVSLSGTWNGIEIYTSYTNTVALICYKGGSSECDTGMAYCPYTLLTTTTINPDTYEPGMSFCLRFGLYTSPKCNNYYVRIQVR